MHQFPIFLETLRLGSLLQQRNARPTMQGSTSASVPSFVTSLGASLAGFNVLKPQSSFETSEEITQVHHPLLQGMEAEQTQPLNSVDRYCHECKKYFPFPAALSRHMRTHSGERPYPCSKCPYRAKHRFDLKKHLLSIHKLEQQRWH